MGLRTAIEQDLAYILEGDTTGFQWPIAITNPAGTVENFLGFSNDIAQVIDPDTGQMVSGRVASIAVRISALYAAGFTLPRGISDAKQKPWVVKFDDINGKAHTFKVESSDPDRGLGLLTCMLEAYEVT